MQTLIYTVVCICKGYIVRVTKLSQAMGPSSRVQSPGITIFPLHMHTCFCSSFHTHTPLIPLLEQCCFCSGRWESSRKASKTQGALLGMVLPAEGGRLSSEQLQHMTRNFCFLWRNCESTVFQVLKGKCLETKVVLSTKVQVSDCWCFHLFQLCWDKVAVKCLTAS